MNMNAIWKGLSIGATVGSAVFMLVKATETKKRNIRRDASKTLKSAKNLVEDISSVVM